MKVYHGRRSEHGCVVEGDGKVCSLNPRLDLRNHSPTGLEWGYQRLQCKLIAARPRGDWVLTESRLRQAIDAIEQDRGWTR